MGEVTSASAGEADPEAFDREDFLDAFLFVANAVEPDHAYDEDPYPLTPENVEYSYTTGSWARCGPRRAGPIQAYLAVNVDVLTNMLIEEVLMLMTHEVTHLTQRFRRGDPVHPPSFWREFAFHAQCLIDAWPDVVERYPGAHCAEYRAVVIDDPNGSTVDRRFRTVEATSAELERYVAEYRAHDRATAGSATPR